MLKISGINSSYNNYYRDYLNSSQNLNNALKERDNLRAKMESGHATPNDLKEYELLKDKISNLGNGVRKLDYYC